MEHSDLFRIVFTLICSIFASVTAVMFYLAAWILNSIRKELKEMGEWKASITIDFEHLKTEHAMLSCQKKREEAT